MSLIFHSFLRKRSIFVYLSRNTAQWKSYTKTFVRNNFLFFNLSIPFRRQFVKKCDVVMNKYDDKRFRCQVVRNYVPKTRWMLMQTFIDVHATFLVWIRDAHGDECVCVLVRNILARRINRRP